MSLLDRLRPRLDALSADPRVGRFVRVARVTWSTPDILAEIWTRFARLEELLAIDRRVARERAESLAVRADVHGRELDEVQRRLVALAQAGATATARLDDQQRQLADHGGTLEYLLGRVEFVRRELMFELRYGAKSPTADKLGVADPQVIATEKLAAARGGVLRLNLGCGHVALEGFLNVDRRALPGVDIVADADKLPLTAGEADEIFSAHMLEHFPEEQLRRELLPYWKSLLKPRGTFRAVVPDAEAMMRAYATGRMPYADLREVTFGAQDYDGDFHFNMFTPAHLSGLLAEAGFSDVQVLAEGRPNGKCYEFEIMGRS